MDSSQLSKLGIVPLRTAGILHNEIVGVQGVDEGCWGPLTCLFFTEVPSGSELGVGVVVT